MDNNIKLSKETLELLFSAAQMPVPETLDDNAVKKAINSLAGKPEALELVDETQNYSDEEWKKDCAKSGLLNEGKSILIIDDIGVVTYQLKVLFTKNNFEVETAKDIYSAINIFKKNRFSFVVMDLFVSTEREGFLLLDEIKRIIINNKLNTKIIVITASNKGEYKVKCLNRGANLFIQKDVGWQDELLKYTTEELSV